MQKCRLNAEQQGAVVQAARKIIHLGEDRGIRFGIGAEDFSPREYANRLFTILEMDVQFAEPEAKPAKQKKPARRAKESDRE